MCHKCDEAGGLFAELQAGQDDKPFTLSRLAQPLIEAHKMMTHGLMIRPTKAALN